MQKSVWIGAFIPEFATYKSRKPSTRNGFPVFLLSIRALAAELGVSVITTKRAYEELEKDGLLRSVAGKGFYVCEYNTDYLKEKQLILLEKRLGEVIYEAKQAGLSCEDFVEIAQTLYKEN